MAEAVGNDNKRLGNVKIAVADTEESLYAPAASKYATITALIVTETGGATATVIAGIADGATLATNEFLFSDHSLAANEFMVLAVNLPIEDGQDLRIEASTTNVVFQAFGSEGDVI